MDTFLEKCSLLKLTQKETEKLSSPVSIKEIDIFFIKKNFLTKKTPGSGASSE